MEQRIDGFNKKLMQGLNPEAFAPEGDTGQLRNPAERKAEGTDSGLGSIRVQVTLARGAIPVPGAKVTITRSGGGVAAELVTDQSGRTPKVTLPAPAASYSQSPGDVRPYSVYHIKVEVPGYYTEDAVNVPIFDGIDSIQPISLSPLPEGAGMREEIYSDESPAAEL